MSDIAIRVENLGKRYRIGRAQKRHDTLRDALADSRLQIANSISRVAKSALRRANGNSPSAIRHSPSAISDPPSADHIWALKDVSFEVKRGEVVGIIGRNGAGKSTLLKILSRITKPTEGWADVYGRMGTLLEVGTGFHNELSGRENIYLSGAIIGMKKVDIDRKFDEIVAFAEVDKFIDTPVKHYSSGMYVRLAFAVAAHLEPEILLVDEVLAVGDAAFQKKCLGKMSDVAREGRTVLFVSHNMTAIRTLCSRAILFSNGSITDAGIVNNIVESYLQTGAVSQLEKRWSDPKTAPGDDRVRLHRACVAPFNQDSDGSMTVETALRFEYEFWNYLPNALLNFSVVLYNLEGVPIFNTFSNPQEFRIGLVRGSFIVPQRFLNDAVYTVRLLIVRDTSVALLDLHDLLTFEVHDIERQGNWYGKWVGVIRPQFDWDLELVETRTNSLTNTSPSEGI